MHPSLRGFIINALRRAWGKSWAKRNCLESAKSECKDGRYRVQFQCACCKQQFHFKEVQVDHIVPVLGLAGFDTWEGVIERMFVGPEGLQVLCKPCHKEKSATEAGVRANAKRSKKESAKQARPVPATSDANVRKVRKRAEPRRKLGSIANGAGGEDATHSE